MQGLVGTSCPQNVKSSTQTSTFGDKKPEIIYFSFHQ
jgi:hypothetical protein